MIRYVPYTRELFAKTLDDAVQLAETLKQDVSDNEFDLLNDIIERMTSAADWFREVGK